jgi:DNA-binding PadR family transcriptional regulator
MSGKLHPVDAVILGRLYDRPAWLRSLQAVRPRWRKLEDSGLVERMKPPTGTAKNMLKITPKGAQLIEAHWQAVKPA